MAKHGLQPKGVARRNKIILSAVKLFLENGYERTTTSQIMAASGMAQSSFFAAFENKEALLLVLTKQMFANQFSNVEQLVPEGEPLMLYAAETALQMHITELSSSLREIYVMTYSLPSTSEFIYTAVTPKLMKVFSSYMPDAQEKDFYEIDIASSGVTRGFMAKKCDMYFTMDMKLRRYLSCCFKLFDVPKEDYEPVIERVLQMDLHSVAEKIIADTIQRAEAGFETVIAERSAEEQ